MKDMQLQNYACGECVKGPGKQSELVDAITGDLIGTTSSGGLYFGHMLNYARTVVEPPPLHMGRARGKLHVTTTASCSRATGPVPVEMLAAPVRNTLRWSGNP